MFDYKKIMKEGHLVEPIPSPYPKEFPSSQELPEGCLVIDDLGNDWGYQMDFYTDIVYATKDEMDLHMILIVPRPHFGSTQEEMKKEYKWPCIAYIQGSAFHKQNLYTCISRHIRMVEKGYAVAIIEYRYSDIAPFPAQVEDAKTAIRYLRKNAELYHLDKEHFAVAGDSSGAYTALMVGFTQENQFKDEFYSEYSSQVNCIIDSYAPTAFMLMNYYPSSQDHIQPDSPEGFELGGKNVLEHLDEAEKASPLYYLDKDTPTPPTLILHGSRDMLVPFNQSCVLYNYMKELGKEVTFYKLMNANHGCHGFDSDKIVQIVLDFLEKNI